MKKDTMVIYLATDHAGFALKNVLKAHLEAQASARGWRIEDVGAHTLDPDDDYPEYMVRAGMAIAEDAGGASGSMAIILGWSGQGEAIVANRFPGVRAAVYYGGPLDIIALSRQHNDANVLSLGAHFLTEAQAKEAIDLWLSTPFSREERHERRIAEIDSIS